MATVVIGCMDVGQLQNNKRLKEHFFNLMKRDKTCKFLRKPPFSSYAQHENRKTNNSSYLVSFRCGKLAEGKGHEGLVSWCFEPSQRLGNISWLSGCRLEVHISQEVYTTRVVLYYSR